MAMQELNREAMLTIIGEAFGDQAQDKQEGETLKLWKERNVAFLKKADELLQVHGYDNAEEGEPPQRLTRPVDILDNKAQIQLAAQVQVIRYITNQFYNTDYQIRHTQILATEPNTGRRYSLFGIHEGIGKNVIENRHRGPVAARELLHGLQAINFIGDQLANQPIPTNAT